jgi:hypothetical protein
MNITPILAIVSFALAITLFIIYCYNETLNHLLEEEKNKNKKVIDKISQHRALMQVLIRNKSLNKSSICIAELININQELYELLGKNPTEFSSEAGITAAIDQNSPKSSPVESVSVFN